MNKTIAKITENTPVQQEPESFEFTKENLKKAKTITARYPEGRQASAIMPLLDLAQRQCGGWLPEPAIVYIADYLSIPHIRAFEVVSFYTMYNTSPIGKYHIQVCGTTPCMLCGAEDIIRTCESKLGITLGETTDDGLFTLTEVECLGACVNAPMAQINDEYYTDLNNEVMEQIIKKLTQDKEVKPESQIGRQGSAPLTGPTTLTKGGA